MVNAIKKLFTRKEQQVPERNEAAVNDKYLLDFPLYEGHKVFEYCRESDTLNLAKATKKVFKNKTVWEVECTEPNIYVSALNKKNARKQVQRYLGMNKL